ncbi:MAG: hypothetical protein WBP45_01695 [Daejeonella sp.]
MKQSKKNQNPQKEKPDHSVEQEWENPKSPEDTKDERDKEQMKRQLEEAKRRSENLTDGLQE